MGDRRGPVCGVDHLVLTGLVDGSMGRDKVTGQGDGTLWFRIEFAVL